MRFAKLHGLGNDFVVIDLRGALTRWQPDPAWARQICDRHRGVGADGVLTLLDLPPAERPALPGALAARLIIHNPDGSRPEMCGNGARCAALWMATRGCSEPGRAQVLLETDAGPRPCAVEASEISRGAVEVGMGPPRLEPERTFSLRGASALATPVSMGNPHRVFFVDGAETPWSHESLAALCAEAGPALCAAEDANIEFVRSLGPQRFAAAVWERGAGATQACGTGACAVAAAAVARGLARGDEPIVVELPGGALTLRMEAGEMKMRGPAELVFRGELAAPP